MFLMYVYKKYVCTLILAFNVRNISNLAVHSYVDHYNILLLFTDIINETLHSDIVMRCRHSNASCDYVVRVHFMNMQSFVIVVVRI